MTPPRRRKHFKSSPVNLLAMLKKKRRIRRTTGRQLRNGKRMMKKRRTSEKQVRNPKIRGEVLEQVRERRVNWLDVPRDIMIVIFSKLSTVDLLKNVQFVCSSWLQVSKDQQLFRSIILPPVGEKSLSFSMKLLKDAVDRSCGELIEIFLEKAWCTLEVLLYVVQSSKSLKRLRMKDWDDRCELSGRGLVEVCKKAPVLEELDLDRVYDISLQIMKEIGKSCSELKIFRYVPRIIPCSAYLVTIIANSMPQLRGLHLSFTSITNEALQAILNKCHLLEKLDLRDCFYFDLCGDLVKQTLGRIRGLILPSHKVPPLADASKYRPSLHKPSPCKHVFVNAVIRRSSSDPGERMMAIMGDPRALVSRRVEASTALAQQPRS